MKILVVNTKIGAGGAAGLARTIAEGYTRAGHEVHWWVGLGEPGPDRTLVDPPGYRGPLGRWLTRLWQRREGGDPMGKVPGRVRRVFQMLRPRSALAQALGREDFDLAGFKASEARLPWKPDLIHLHNLHAFTHYTHWDLRRLPHWSHVAPTVVSLHDPWLFTGHCAHFFGCDRWRSGCGSCPDLHSYPRVLRDSTARNWQVKADIYRRSRLHVVSGCDWVVNIARDSMMAPGIATARTIRYGTDLERYRPAAASERAALRAEIGAEAGDFVLVYGAEQGVANPFRDFLAMRRAASLLARALAPRRVIAVELGGHETGVYSVDGYTRREEGYVPAATVIRRMQASDVLLHAAIADTCPLVVYEAQACGLPVVSTRVGGIPEQVREGETGLLASRPEAGELTAALVELSRDQRAASMGRAARVFMERNHALQRMLDDHNQLAGELTGLG